LSFEDVVCIGESSIMVKTEADSSDVTDSPHHVTPRTGMFICLECIRGES